jgi:uncharacterized membrane protein
MKQQLIFTLDLLSMGCILFMLATGLFYYGALPDQIPLHFNASGQADDFAHKAMVFLLPGIAIAVSVVVWLIGRDPKNYNFPIKVTDNNREALSAMAREFISVIMLLTNALLAYIHWGMLQIGLGFQQSLNPVIVWLFVALILLLSVNSYFRMKKLAK